MPSTAAAQISVIVRARDKVGTIGATLESLRRQTVPAEIIVVDSGSTDGTLELANRWADQVIEIPPAEFTYGGALNTGAAAASCDVHASLSAHCVLPTDTWVADSLRRYERFDVAATNQREHTPTGQPILDTYWQTLADAAARPGWGFSNHASTWRADVWKEQPFREDLLACEDKEWSWQVLASGRTIAYGPDLFVGTVHRRAAGFSALVERVGREAEAMVSMGAADPLSTAEFLQACWSSFPTTGPRPRWVRRASPLRLAELLGSWLGGRRARPLPEVQLGELLAAHGLHRAPWPYLPW
ncbi:glycosyltransferase [Modestobacter sp. SSW1-42]|uniref:glycosyltransferase n=1 Tax=Modestobacter sp. SSW1-42 TaxID=596372 RepID=UPI00398673BC